MPAAGGDRYAEIAEGEVLVKIKAAGVNPVDAKIRAGEIPAFCAVPAGGHRARHQRGYWRGAEAMAVVSRKGTKCLACLITTGGRMRSMRWLPPGRSRASRRDQP